MNHRNYLKLAAMSVIAGAMILTGFRSSSADESMESKGNDASLWSDLGSGFTE